MKNYRECRNWDAFKGSVFEGLSMPESSGFVGASQRILSRDFSDSSILYETAYKLRVRDGNRAVPYSQLSVNVRLERGDGSIEELLESNLQFLQKKIEDAGVIRVENLGMRLGLRNRVKVIGVPIPDMRDFRAARKA